MICSSCGRSGPAQNLLTRTLMHFAIQDALNRCQKQPGDKCLVYAQNGDVVWRGPVAAPAAVAQSPPSPSAANPQIVATERVTQAAEQNRPQASPSRSEEPRKALPAGAAVNRRALIFGNDSYKFVPGLSNARADARAIATALTAWAIPCARISISANGT